MLILTAKPHLYLPSRPEVAIDHTAPVKLYRGFASKLHHEVPNWVADGALFHVRIALDRAVAQRTLTNTTLAPALLDSANLYEAKERWHITLFVLMPDHLHAVLSFPRQDAMSQVI